MKKLLFAIAGAAAFAAFAGSDPAAGEGVISLVGFEAYTTNTTVLGYNDQGQSGNSLWTSTGDDESRVQAYGGDNATAPSAPDVSFPAPFTEVGAGDNYLALDTSGAELQRAIPVAGQAVAATGTYIDTLVQFTVTEDEEPTIDGTTKLAIWMGVGDGATNLYVKGGYMVGPVGEGGVTIDTTDRRTYKLDSVVEPGAWYRLTVKAVVIDDDGAGNCISGYQVFIDGTLATSETAVCDEAAVQYYTTYANADGIFPGAAGLLSAKTIIPSCAGVQSDATITSVGFQGTGAIDDFVVTTNDPFPPSAIDFTLTWTASEVSAVSYVLSTDLATTNSLTSGTAVQLAPGDGTATIELIPTFETGYEFDKVTMGETELGLTFAIPGVTTNATLVAKAAAPAYPTYIDITDTTIKGKYDAWKQAVGFDDSSTSTHLNQFLLNVDESATVGDTALEITEIKQNATAGWDITIGCTLDGVGLTGTVGETIVCNGYLAVSYTDSLTGTWHTENIAVTAVDATTGTVTVNVNKANAKFMKVTLTAAPAPQE